MTDDIERLVRCFEQGAMSRRELIAGLGALCVAPAVATDAAPSQPQSEPRTPIPLSGIDHIALRVSDLTRSTAFYRDRLGGRIRSQSSDSTFLDIGTQWVALFARGAVSTGYEATRPALTTYPFTRRSTAVLTSGWECSAPTGSTRCRRQAATASIFATRTESSCN